MEREGRREGKGEGRRRGGEMRKGIIMALFLGISFLMISCGNGGPEPKEGQVATADGTILNLKAIGNNINSVVKFIMDVEEVKSLISSIDELAKGIGKKINSSPGIVTDGSNGTDKNNTLLAGVYEVASLIETKTKSLQVGESFKDKGLEAKIEAVKKSAGDFKTKLTTQHNNLGSSGAVTDDNAKQAIDRINKSSGANGAQQLAELYAAVDALLNTAKRDNCTC